MNGAHASSLSRKQPVSVRKVEANRRNALKSTGPKTANGKANSRKNAIKHGLFIRQVDGLLIEDDEDETLGNFHKRLWNELQPVGLREESEIAYIAICWLRLDRLWRYENAEIKSAHHQVANNLERGFYDLYAQVPERRKIMSLLLSAEAEVKTNGLVSPELLEKIFEEDLWIKTVWRDYEYDAGVCARRNIREIAKTIADERKIPLSQARLLLTENPEATVEFARFVAGRTIRNIIDFRWKPWWDQAVDIQKTARQLEIIPDDAVEKVIRYGNAIERQLSRAYARLDRLQSRRKGESVHAPLVDVYLTR